MKKLNRFFAICCVLGSMSLYSQTSTGWFHQVEDDVVKPLPQVLLSFDAIIVDKKVELTWSSDTENNNNFFTVEKSKDAFVFEDVVTIKGFGNYSNIMSYYDIDYNPYEGISYYRLSQTDAEGNVLSSRLVSVNNTNASNSFASSTNLLEDPSGNMMGSENKEVIVVLRNEKGMESFSKVIVDKNNNVTVPADSDYKLDNGTYTVIASSNNKLYSQKVVVR